MQRPNYPKSDRQCNNRMQQTFKTNTQCPITPQTLHCPAVLHVVLLPSSPGNARLFCKRDNCYLPARAAVNPYMRLYILSPRRLTFSRAEKSRSDFQSISRPCNSFSTRRGLMDVVGRMRVLCRKCAASMVIWRFLGDGFISAGVLLMMPSDIVMGFHRCVL